MRGIQFAISNQLRNLTLLLLLGVFPSAGAGVPLTISVVGSGSVSANPNLPLYPEGSVVTLTASPSNGWKLAGWSGDASGLENPINVTITSARTVTATFAMIPTFPLNVHVDGAGSVQLDPPGGNYLSNTTVTISAVPEPGWSFVGWLGGVVSTLNPLPVVVRSATDLSGRFVQLPAIVTQPVSVSVNLGAPASLKAEASGTLPLSYQWWFGGVPLADATNSVLSIAHALPSHHGEYYVVVSNPWGVATSRSATLSVFDDCLGVGSVGTCDDFSLRTAMAAGGVVRICCNGVITLTNTIEIVRDVALDARGRNVTVSGNHAVRLFHVRPGITFAATNLTLANGMHLGRSGTNWTGIGGPGPSGDPGQPGVGGAILNEGGTVVLVESILSGNKVLGGSGGLVGSSVAGISGDGRGGALASLGGTLKLVSVTASGNTAAGGPGPAIFSGHGAAGRSLGGAIYSLGSFVELTDCRLVNNLARAQLIGRGYGGALFQEEGGLHWRNGVVVSNEVTGAPGEVGSRPGEAFGGAVAVVGAKVEIDQVEFTSNRAIGGSGFRHSGAGLGFGGAIYSTAWLRLVDCKLSNNTAASGGASSSNADGCGGAIFNAGPLELERCTVAANLAKGGDGVNISNGAFPAGHGLGGGLYSLSAVTMTNCTIALNTARGGEGAFPNGAPGNGLGGGCYVEGGAVTGVSLTVASNSVATGRYWPSTPSPALITGANLANSNGTLFVRNSLLAGGPSANVYGPITDGGYNLSSDGSAAFSSGSSFNFTDPRLAPLFNYGGNTPTMALSPNSPAIGFGTSVGTPSVDQRGFSRPFGVSADIGAYEYHSDQSRLPRLTIVPLANAEARIQFEAWSGFSYRLQSGSDLSDWDTLETIGPFAENTFVQRDVPATGQPGAFFRIAIDDFR